VDLGTAPVGPVGPGADDGFGEGEVVGGLGGMAPGARTRADGLGWQTRLTPSVIVGLVAVVGLLVGAVGLWIAVRGDPPSQPTNAAVGTTSVPTPDGGTGHAGAATDAGRSAESGAGSDPSGPSTGDAGASGPVAFSLRLEDPLGLTSGTGTAELTLDATIGEVCYDFDTTGIAGPYDGHIHVGPAGVKGGIVIDFGQLDGQSSGCLRASPVDVASILADLAGHYVEFHDADGATTIRVQLADADPTAPAADDELDPGTDGAVVLISPGALVLSGAVPDQTTIDKMIETFADIDLGETEIVNDLRIEPGSPRPSGRIIVDAAILFEWDSDELTDPDNQILRDLAIIFRARPAWHLTIVGHTDASGDDVYNLELSLRRAASVRDLLVAAGVDESVVGIEGAGQTRPRVSNDTPEGRAENRRIEFEIEAA
jgi:outer membrane protein OmpA-like peptidoglycan-associated protein